MVSNINCSGKFHPERQPLNTETCPTSTRTSIKWKRSDGDYVESHCGRWWITPIYGGLTRPERYELRHNASGTVGGWKVVGSGQTQRACKAVAEDL